MVPDTSNGLPGGFLFCIFCCPLFHYFWHVWCNSYIFGVQWDSIQFLHTHTHCFYLPLYFPILSLVAFCCHVALSLIRMLLSFGIIYHDTTLDSQTANTTSSLFLLSLLSHFHHPLFENKGIGGTAGHRGFVHKSSRFSIVCLLAAFCFVYFLARKQMRAENTTRPSIHFIIKIHSNSTFKKDVIPPSSVIVPILLASLPPT